jgi:subtilase family serine protease
MYIKPDSLRVLGAALLCSLLLITIASAVPFTRDHLADAILGERGLHTHRIQLQPVLARYKPMTTNAVTNAGTAPQQIRFACQSNTNPQPSLCYGPYQLREAYKVNDLITKQGITGKGTSITIIDAYGSPNIRKDLQTFNATWGLPNARLNVIAPYGIDGQDSAWISETSLDVEWAHVMAPEATINLLVARDSNDYSIYKMLAYAVKHNLGDVISLSFGESESCVDPDLRLAEHRLFVEATRKGMTLLAATGDFGSAQLSCDGSSFQKAISFPTDDPLITAVGGTALKADAITGQYIRETTWNESASYNKATGGGYSKLYQAPSFQRGLLPKNAGRGVPDLSLNASVNGGVVVLESHRSGRPIINIMGGTSAAAPELAGLFADAVQMAHHRLGPLNAALYKIGTGSNYHQLMHDIISGNNILLSSGLGGYTAGDGWDAVTGWGSPKNAGQFLEALISASQATAPITGAPIVPVSPIQRTPVLPLPVTPTPPGQKSADQPIPGVPDLSNQHTGAHRSANQPRPLPTSPPASKKDAHPHLPATRATTPPENKKSHRHK